MSPLKLGFALEGKSDYPVIQILSRRVLAENFPDVMLEEPVETRSRNRGHGFIRTLPAIARELHDRGAMIVVAVVDADTALSERRRLLQTAIDQCNGLVPVCIATGLALHSLEAWLLADERAIHDEFDGDRSQVHFPNPEAELHPKETLTRIVSILTGGAEVSFANYSKTLAEKIGLRMLSERCQQFDEFARNLINCVKEQQRIQAGLPSVYEESARPIIRRALVKKRSQG